ncbi:hypothetical protein [Segatella baroniae]|uniref:hypothetical protein n=1 Tax=Segatella baroniae TaxID=305719 RepID=UPI0005657EB4|nr:hypothetical protein [Segatella baroniae]
MKRNCRAFDKWYRYTQKNIVPVQIVDIFDEEVQDENSEATCGNRVNVLFSVLISFLTYTNFAALTLWFKGYAKKVNYLEVYDFYSLCNETKDLKVFCSEYGVNYNKFMNWRYHQLWNETLDKTTELKQPNAVCPLFT